MTTSKKNLRTCEKGHKYYKSSDCPTCPECEQERKPDAGFLSVPRHLPDVHWKAMG